MVSHLSFEMGYFSASPEQATVTIGSAGNLGDVPSCVSLPMILGFTLGKVSAFLLPRSVTVTGDLPVYYGDVTSSLFPRSVYITGDLLADSAMLPSPARWTVTKGGWLLLDSFNLLIWGS